MILKHGKEVQCKYITEGMERERELRQQGCLQYKPETLSSVPDLMGGMIKLGIVAMEQSLQRLPDGLSSGKKVTSECTAISETSVSPPPKLEDIWWKRGQKEDT